MTRGLAILSTECAGQQRIETVQTRALSRKISSRILQHNCDPSASRSFTLSPISFLLVFNRKHILVVFIVVGDALGRITPKIARATEAPPKR